MNFDRSDLLKGCFSMVESDFFQVGWIRIRTPDTWIRNTGSSHRSKISCIKGLICFFLQFAWRDCPAGYLLWSEWLAGKWAGTHTVYIKWYTIIFFKSCLLYIWNPLEHSTLGFTWNQVPLNVFKIGTLLELSRPVLEILFFSFWGGYLGCTDDGVAATQHRERYVAHGGVPRLEPSRLPLG